MDNTVLESQIQQLTEELTDIRTTVSNLINEISELRVQSENLNCTCDELEFRINATTIAEIVRLYKQVAEDEKFSEMTEDELNQKIYELLFTRE